MKMNKYAAVVAKIKKLALMTLIKRKAEPAAPSTRFGDMERYQLTGSERVLWVHNRAKCAGQNCCIHNPSNHHMREWPQNWRDGRGVMERICPHGIGHPDPDDPAFQNEYEAVHGCDGCCDTSSR